MASNTLTGLMVILMLVVFFSVLFWPNEPLSDRMALDDICDYYFKILATEGEMSSQEEATLRSRLEAQLFDDVSISIIEGREHGSEVKLIVNAKKTYQVQNGLNQEEKIMELQYERTTLCTKLEVAR